MASWPNTSEMSPDVAKNAKTEPTKSINKMCHLMSHVSHTALWLKSNVILGVHVCVCVRVCVLMFFVLSLYLILLHIFEMLSMNRLKIRGIKFTLAIGRQIQ